MARARFQNPVFDPNSDLGFTLPGALLNFYEVGQTVIRKDTFIQLSSGSANTNPVVADGDGRFSNIYLDGVYNVVLTDADANVIWTRDNVASVIFPDPSLLSDGSAAAPSYSFDNAPDTGFYLAATNALGVSVAGDQVAQWGVNGLDITLSGSALLPTLTLEKDADTGWYQGAVGDWFFTSAGEEMLSLKSGVVTITGPSEGTAILETSALTGQVAITRLSGADIAHGLTDLAPTDVFYQVEPISGTQGGAQVTAISAADQTALIYQAIIGNTNPTNTIPALQFRVGKSDGGTGAQDLANLETALKISNHDGTTDLLTVNGQGTQTIAGNLDVGLNVTLNNGNVVFETSGTGVDFSAAAGGTGNLVTSSLLDDYEEGTFLPELWDATLSGSESQVYDIQEGFYTKIGNRVFFTAVVAVSDKGTLAPAQAASIGALPYTNGAFEANTYTGAGNDVYVLTAGENVMGFIDGSNNYVQLTNWGDVNGAVTLLIQEIQLNGAVVVSGNYAV